MIPQPQTKVLLHTTMGDITIALRNDMPITAGNFKNLSPERKHTTAQSFTESSLAL